MGPDGDICVVSAYEFLNTPLIFLPTEFARDAPPGLVIHYKDDFV